jgi:hypothetical protein
MLTLALFATLVGTPPAEGTVAPEVSGEEELTRRTRENPSWGAQQAPRDVPSPSDDTRGSGSTDEGARAPAAQVSASDLRFVLHQVESGREARGVVVTLRPLRPPADNLDLIFVERSLDRGKVSFRVLPHGEYEVTLYASGAELSFHYSHDGSRDEPIRALMPRSDRSGKGVSANPDRLLWGGVSATSLGGALLVGGLLAVALNPCGSDGSTGGDCRSDLRTAWGIALASAGGAGVGTGVTMMAIGRHRRLQLRPGVETKVNSASLVLRGKF